MANDENVQPVKLKPVLEAADTAPRRAKPSETPSSQHLMGLVAYLLALLLLALGGLVYLLLLANFSSTSAEILRTLGFIGAGAMIGSVLYQVRAVFRRYYEGQNHENIWLGECLSAPWESVALSVVALSLIRGMAFVLGGYAATGAPAPVAPELAKTYGFVAFGAGALVGFGTYEMAGWLRNLMKAMFPAALPERNEAEAQNHTLRRSKAS